MQFFAIKDHLSVKKAKCKITVQFSKKSCANSLFHLRVPNPYTALISGYGFTISVKVKLYTKEKTPSCLKRWTIMKEKNWQ